MGTDDVQLVDRVLTSAKSVHAKQKTNLREKIRLCFLHDQIRWFTFVGFECFQISAGFLGAKIYQNGLFTKKTRVGNRGEFETLSILPNATYM